MERGHPIALAGVAPTRAESFSDTIDIRSIFSALWGGKWIILATTLIAGALAYEVVSNRSAVYKADAEVLIDTQQANVPLRGVLEEQRIDDTHLEDQILVLSSTPMIERVIDRLYLDQSAWFNPYLWQDEKTPGFVEQLIENAALPPSIVALLIDAGLIEEAEEEPSTPSPSTERLAVIENVKEGLSLWTVGGSRVIKIAYFSGNPDLAAALANAFAEEYVASELEGKREKARAATEWLATRVAELRSRVTLAEEAVEEARQQATLRRGQTLEVTRQQLADNSARLTEARSDVRRAERHLQRLKTALAADDEAAIMALLRDAPIHEGIRQMEAELVAEEATLSASVSDTNPALVLVRQQLARVRDQMKSAAEQVVAEADYDLASAKAREESLLLVVRELEQKVLDQSADEVRLRELEREADASRTLYVNLLGRLQETAAQEDLQSSDARILSRAEIPLKPEFQENRRTIMLALFLGGAAGVGIALLLRWLNHTFRSPRQLQEMTGERVLGMVPQAGPRLGRLTFAALLRARSSSAIREAARSVRTSILLAAGEKPPHVVMISSSLPSEGKSTTAMLLAMTSRQAGKNVVVVDCDLRKPAMAKMLRCRDNRPGLRSVLEGRANAAEAMFEEPKTGLHVLMTKHHERRSSRNPADLLSSKEFEDLVAELRSSYDLVVLDSPPALVVSDARILAGFADAVVHVVRWGKTPRDAVVDGLDELRSVNAPIRGLVMTQVDEDRAARLGYEGYIHYRGRYRDYYAS